MNKWYGWAGRLMRVNLSSGTIKEEELSTEKVHLFLGGRGLNAQELWGATGRNTDPLGPDNLLALGVGPLGGIAPLSSRVSIESRSPLTGLLGSANSGGYWGSELKAAGWDQILITGRAPTPVYLFIENGKAELREAKGIWGKNISESELEIKRQLRNPKIRVLGIGQAGENLVKFAAVMNDRYRAAARTGLGAVFGSKCLKAIAVKGDNRIPVARPDRFREAVRESRKHLTHTQLGTTMLIRRMGQGGYLAWKNWSSGLTPNFEEITGERFVERYVTRDYACFYCPRACGHIYEVKEGPFKGVRGGGVEYETLAAAGPLCGHTNLEAILAINNLCNEYGLDTISANQTIACAMDWFEKGLITREDMDGIDLRWGNWDAQVQLIHKIARREGVGALLAEGAYLASKKIGKEAEYQVIHIKGMDNNLSELRHRPAWALGHITSTRGADHLRGMPTVASNEEASIKFFGDRKIADKWESLHVPVIWSQHYFALCDSLSICKCGDANLALPPHNYSTPQNLAWMFREATGWDVHEQDLMHIGERIYNLERAFNVRLGISRRDDVLPSRWYKEGIQGGPLDGTVISAKRMERAKDRFYQGRGWDKEGIPRQGPLDALGLGDQARVLSDLMETKQLGNYAPYVSIGREKGGQS